MSSFAIILAVIWGVLAAVQSPTNASLGKITGGIQASVISFGGGFLVLLILSFLFGSGNPLLFVNAPWWQLLGGAYGSLVVFGTIISVPYLGVALTLTVLMLGQLFMGVIIDTLGLLGAEITQLSPLRILGIVLAICGIFCIYISKKKFATVNDSSSNTKKMLGCILVMFTGGVCGSIQVPTNTSLSHTVGSIEASLVSFGGGLIILSVLMIIYNRGKWHSTKGAKPWQLLGGLYGALGVFITIITMPYLGVVVLMAGSMFGQLAAGMLIDMAGLFAQPKIKMDKWRVAGILLFAVCIVVTTIGRGI